MVIDLISFLYNFARLPSFIQI